MKHINLKNWKGTITDWTELNYIKGGLDDAYADIANISGNYLNHIKGTYPYNQLVANGNFESETIWRCTSETGNITFSNNNLIYTQTTTSGSNRITANTLGTITNHKYLVLIKINYLDNLPNTTVFVGSGGYDGYQFGGITNTNTWYTLTNIFTRNSTSGDDKFSIYPRLPNDNDRVQIAYAETIDLTALFGSGNEPTDVTEARAKLVEIGINPDEYNEYNSGTTQAVDKLIIENNSTDPTTYITIN